MTRYMIVISRENFAADLEAAGVIGISLWTDKFYEDDKVLLSWIGAVPGLDHYRVNVLEKNGFTIDINEYSSIVQERFPIVPIEIFALF